MSRRSQRNASKNAIFYNEEDDTDDSDEKRDNSVILSSNIKAFGAGSHSSSDTTTGSGTEDKSEADTQPFV